ncbi:ankyrin repeat-containing domain protein [Rhexocercosporidium sp. MPI-PUGE-AT-0058]|nr:ankyrin repeat-containing domain protein [Rhexocercosporidium sp. MPI-PUGE-AT-0058]
MVTLAESKDPIEIPTLPTESVKDFIPYLASNPETPIATLLEPFKKFEGELRKVYAQQPEHELVKDGNVNLVPIFAGHEQELKIRARSLETESDDEKSKYIMPLSDVDRKANGSPAVVSSFKDFQKNFNLFSESSLAELDWNNVVAAGSAVTTSLLPVPEKWAGSKRSLREYYHEHLAPASDVDLFLYGLNEEEGLEKIKQIEKNIKDGILHETTTIRTKNAITIASQYPTRHVQIVLRLYDSVSQIITGFDVDCACAAYDGKQVYAAPRAVAAFATQCNTIDLTRRSPSYENRLSKYSRRGFEVHWPLMDRNRIDPTIFERSFGRTQGLARLLILEKLPKTVDREAYMDQRRAERGRPALHRGYRNQFRMGGNIKDAEEDEVAEWVDQEEVASYHTMTVPYGPKYQASRINRLLYAKDLLLNAEWNQPKEREVYLHRHPCFFGTAEEILQDCCGYCPVPKTDEEIEVAEEESKTYISGPLKFLMDDPGRQEIGSFNPITDEEWTTMAYVGDTARLCQAIVDGDLEHVQDWCAQEDVDVNRRDYTGRTPLHLATMASTPEIVQCLIDNGARLIARLVDGRTALHIAAARGNVEMVKSLMQKSEANEEEEEEKVEARRKARKAADVGSPLKVEEARAGEDMSDDESEASEISLGSEEGSDSMTMGSFVKVADDKPKEGEDIPEDDSEEPDIYEIDVIAWDYGLSPLHLAILNGHPEIIELLVSEYGADVLLPVKLVQPGTSNARGAIMSILLALSLPAEKAKEVVKLLLKLGATSAQADMNHYTVFHYVVAEGRNDILDILLTQDKPRAMSVLDNVGQVSHWQQGYSPLTTAIDRGNEEMVIKLLALGTKPEVDFDTWVKTYLAQNPYAKNNSPEQTRLQYQGSINQPIIAAAIKDLGKSIQELLSHGADPKTLEKSAYGVVNNPQNAIYQVAESLLDIVQRKLKALREWTPSESSLKKPETLREEISYTAGLEGYSYWSALRDYKTKVRENKQAWENWKKSSEAKKEDGLEEKKAAIAKLILELEDAEKSLIEAGAKTFAEMYPNTPKHQGNTGYNYNYNYQPSEPAPYKTSLNFVVPELNDAKKDGYIRLFSAAWENNLDTVKTMTLAPWQWKEGSPLESPLKIATTDGNGFSPFSIAVLRGHYHLARKIIEICMAQYHKDDGLSSRQRWTMRTDDSEDEYDSDDGYDKDQDLPIYAELVSDKFTVDNIGEVSNIVKSNVMPLEMIEWTCMPQRFIESARQDHAGRSTLLEHAVLSNNMELLKFIMELGAEQKALAAEEQDDQTSYTISQSVFFAAIKKGRTAMLAEMIKATGVGIPLNALIQKSGVEIKTKPRYYQGLSVGGKKRADWAQAPGGEVHVIEERVPPLLQAAHVASIDSVEWFMSDAPLRRYKEFAEANRHDKRIKTLMETGKGFEKTIGNWLDAKSELVLHCAILFNPAKDQDKSKYLALIKHLVSVAPESIEQKSSEGLTPLHLAVLAHQPEVIKFLLSEGANQRHRDKAGRNVVHHILASKNNTQANTNAENIQQLIRLFDKSAVEEMLLERCTERPGALTPLAYFMSKNSGTYRKPDVVSVLSKYSNGEDLAMINGEGDLPLHVAIKQGMSQLTSFFLSLNPSLLYRENATGRTPLEMSRDIYIASQVENPIPISNSNSMHYYHGQTDYNAIINKSPSSFAVKEPEPEESKKRTWEICASVDAEIAETGNKDGMRKRRLVSLFEANEVAKRVTNLKRGYGGRQIVVNGGLIDGEGKMDVVSEWSTSL